jgi:hypothetical protein
MHLGNTVLALTFTLGLLHSLKFDGMSARESQLIVANADSLDWVWSLPPGHASLTSWLSNRSGVFWIHGKPGSGKSTLMNYLKDHPKTEHYLNKASDRDWVVLRFFFDFRARNGVANDFNGLLRLFLYQLALKVPGLSPSIAKFGKMDMLQPEAQQELHWTPAKLREALLCGLKTCSMNICMLIDGLDEFEGTGKNMMDMIECFQQIDSLDNDHRRMKICIASRPDPLIVTAFGASSGFKLQDYNDRGINLYISNRLKIAAQDPDTPAYTESHLAEFSDEIATRAHGIFLWARFATDELIEGMADGDELSELRARLQALPEELEAIYARILKRTIEKCGDSQEMSVMLQIAYFTLRSLSLQQFFDVFQLSMRKQVSWGSNSLAAFEKRIRAKTGGLVEVTGGLKGKVKLIHETVRAYLDSLGKRSNLPLADSGSDPHFIQPIILRKSSELDTRHSLMSSKHPFLRLNAVIKGPLIPSAFNVSLDSSKIKPNTLSILSSPDERIEQTPSLTELEAWLPEFDTLPQRNTVFDNASFPKTLNVDLDSSHGKPVRACGTTLTEKKRAKAALIRKIGPCILCRISRTKVCVRKFSNSQLTLGLVRPGRAT